MPHGNDIDEFAAMARRIAQPGDSSERHGSEQQAGEMPSKEKLFGSASIHC